jgi:hypothetical protein
MLNLPNQAFIDKFLPKKSFEEKVVNGKKVFKDISKITLKYKLAPNTINIEASENIKEILIFELILNEKNIPKDAIKKIDELVVFPKLYVFKYKDDFCYGIFYKEEKKYFFSNWSETKEFNFNNTNLEKVYENAMIVHAAISGSTNSLLHIPAIAREFGIEIDADTFDKKIEAFACFKSQVREFPNPRSVKSLEALAMVRAVSVGLCKCEAFGVVRIIAS